MQTSRSPQRSALFHYVRSRSRGIEPKPRRSTTLDRGEETMQRKTIQLTVALLLASASTAGADSVQPAIAPALKCEVAQLAFPGSTMVIEKAEAVPEAP